MVVATARPDLFVSATPVGNHRSVATSGKVLQEFVDIRNGTVFPVNIAAEATCGCTLVYLPDDRLKPLRRERMMVSIDTDGLHPGDYTRSVVLDFESRNRSWRRLLHLHFRLLAGSISGRASESPIILL